MKLPKLILMDIDGTLVTDDKQVPPFTKEVLQKLHQQGVLLGLASGKPHFQIQYFADDWGLGFPFDFVVGMNGSEVYSEKEKKLYNYERLSTDELKEITELLYTCEGGNIFIYQDEQMVYQDDSESSRLSSQHNRMRYSVVKDPSEFWQRENAKILDRFTSVELADKAMKLIDCTNKNYYCFKTQPNLLELAPKSVNKANALKAICEKENIAIDDVMAFGDMDNDMEMLRVAGVGVCLCNGAQMSKDAANYITELDNNHEGLAHFIAEKVLRPE